MTRLLLFVVLLASASMLMATGTQDSENDAIKFGAVWPLADITGEQAAKAAEMAVEEINAAGGIMGRPLELIVIDSEFKPDKGAAALERLATVDQVDVFIGGMASGVHLGQIPTLKKYKKLTLWTGAASHKVEEAIGPRCSMVLPPPSLGLQSGAKLCGRLESSWREIQSYTD